MRNRRSRSCGATSGASVRVLKTLAMFGLTLGDMDGAADWSAEIALQGAKLEAALRPGQIATIMGHSGVGKTSLLNALAERVRARGGQVVRADPPWRVAQRTGTAIDRVYGDHEWLARVGLADVRQMCLPLTCLSDGERARLAVAAAMRKAALMAEDVTVVIDEFGGALDDRSAVVLGRVVRRCMHEHVHVRVVVATHRPAVPEAMAAEVRMDLGASAATGRAGV